MNVIMDVHSRALIVVSTPCLGFSESPCECCHRSLLLVESRVARASIRHLAFPNLEVAL